MQLYLNCLSNIECKDISPNCKANLDKCPTNGSTKSSMNVFVETNCQKSCGICGNWLYWVLLNWFGKNQTLCRLYQTIFSNELFLSGRTPVWFEKKKPGRCSIEIKSILDARAAIEECKRDINCVALSDKGCNKKGPFVLCSKVNTWGWSNDCIYKKMTGNMVG